MSRKSVSANQALRIVKMSKVKNRPPPPPAPAPEPVISKKVRKRPPTAQEKRQVEDLYVARFEHGPPDNLPFHVIEHLGNKPPKNYPFSEAMRNMPIHKGQPIGTRPPPPPPKKTITKIPAKGTQSNPVFIE